MFSRWAYILVGENDTGKTSFQRYLVSELCGRHYERLPRNIVKEITHPRSSKSLQTIFTCNRSYQEKQRQYKSVSNYFKHFFEDADICILSSHSSGMASKEIVEMIQELTQRCYNVAGVFWSNNFTPDAQQISCLPWQERLWIENPWAKNDEVITKQLVRIAREFAELLLVRAHAQ